MGTNFYFAKDGKHIGKRSAAGWYCWDCRVTLCMGGNRGVHMGRDDQWYNACPSCKKPIPKEDLSESSAGRELGFNKSNPKKKKGVASCSSFSWACQPDLIENLPPRAKIIENEYGDKFTAKQFEAVLDECPIRFYSSIGKEFS